MSKWINTETEGFELGLVTAQVGISADGHYTAGVCELVRDDQGAVLQFEDLNEAREAALSKAKEAVLNERYYKLVNVLLTRVEDPETKEHVCELIENGFSLFDLETIGRKRNQ